MYDRPFVRTQKSLNKFKKIKWGEVEDSIEGVNSDGLRFDLG